MFYAAVSVSASAGTINFDQRDSGATGGLSYDGNGGALVGKDITFSFVSSPSNSTVTCSGCLLNFTTGNNITEGNGTGSSWTFGTGGSFELTGSVVDGSTTLASGSLLSGQFVGNQVFSRAGNKSGAFVGSGSNTVAAGLAQYFGIDPNSEFMFLTTNFSLGNLTFNGAHGFNGDVDAADLATTTNVPEPQELAMFGLGIALLVGGMAFRRKSGGSDLIG
ncbi:PEP-CTERM sorting domain-containing protein [Salinisphaera sp. T31B1]|uniref:PEP-CTERM sorting domain-containing protein n=1 Tax=Salinisphaera sp. T31B1 TaxID=727963 RepID=UPI0033419D4A